MEIRNFTPRPYQLKIVRTCGAQNTLVVIPTGLGKTKIAILAAKERLDREEGFILVLTPTRPLANQIKNEFIECSNLTKEEVILLTGLINPDKRAEYYKRAKIIIATPQTIKEDVEHGRVSLRGCVLLVIDEAHRSREHFANTIVARQYEEQGIKKRIVALTASPGSTKEKINEICKNLFVEAVEIRSEEDADVREFVQEKRIEYIKVIFPDALKAIHKMVNEVYNGKVIGLRGFGMTKPAQYVNKKDLILMQLRLRKDAQRNPAAYYGISLVAQALKLSFALEMLETQGIRPFIDFLEKLKTEETKAAKNISHDPDVMRAIDQARKMQQAGMEHPKVDELTRQVAKQILEKADARIIIFASYRNTVDAIVAGLNMQGTKTIRLIGQKEGQSQKEQIESIQAFSRGEYNCLVTTNIGEEGLSIGEADTAIFYDNTASGIRKIQRSGRVGRLKSGKIIFMITQGTRDEAYFWKSKKDEAKMKNILYNMQDKNAKLDIK